MRQRQVKKIKPSASKNRELKCGPRQSDSAVETCHVVPVLSGTRVPPSISVGDGDSLIMLQNQSGPEAPNPSIYAPTLFPFSTGYLSPFVPLICFHFMRAKLFP